jgi:hypothetical protein
VGVNALLVEARALEESGEGRNRTGDTMIFSHVLYRLSYLAARMGELARRPARPAW